MKLQPVNLLQVKIHHRGVPIALGRLAIKSGRIYFEYDPTFLERKLPVSPIKLPLRSGVHTAKDQVFDGLFGLFNDSLPDGWGKLLLDRAVLAKGSPYQSLTPLDRLAHVGAWGMGALIYEPDHSERNMAKGLLNLDELQTEVQQVLDGQDEVEIEKLLELGGSSAGARPKVLVGYNPETYGIVNGQQLIPVGYEHWMIKFNAAPDPPDMGRLEYAYSLMARKAGIEMPTTKLFNGRKRAYFGVKRFDREGSVRKHVHTASGLLHADHRLPSLDYENLMRCSLFLNKDIREVEKLFRLAVFNVLAHNRDDHSKNFSFIMDIKGIWSLAPAYDLTFSYGPGGEHSALVGGEGRNPGSRQLMTLAEKFQLKNAKHIVDEVKEVVNQFVSFANEAEVGSKTINAVQGKLKSKLTI